ncbi:NTP transferase domain-containing protein [Dyadobacter sp. NIV53]|uniref:nucleotidyltransferase family protein n=1 Tax=Dyadobacter sp. NIV53 TaxID=2861765 RepID=UPI001C8685B8|nr:nucleotidyltransferase family protein [Dyadobacter sp. NIV53]
MANQNSYGIIILAAGSSSRLGEPKQLLQYQNKSLIRHVAEAAIEAINSPVIIVTGSVQILILEELHELPLHFVQNNEWQEGMASSIRVGISELLKINPQTAGVILVVSDQPFVTSELFLDLIQKAETNENSIIACSYQNTLGTPVLFPKKYFDSLLTLNGAEGAKKLLKRFENDVVSIPFPLGSMDIDTQEDYRRLLGQ